MRCGRSSAVERKGAKAVASAPPSGSKTSPISPSRRHVVVAFDVRLLREIEIAAIGLAFAGKRCLQIVLGFRTFQRCHPSLHFVRDGRPPLQTALTDADLYCIGPAMWRVNAV